MTKNIQFYRFSLRAVSAFVLIAFLSFVSQPPSLFAATSMDGMSYEVVNGTAELEQIDERTLNVRVSADSILNWNLFSIAADQTVNFIMPSIDSKSLNRVTGGEASNILGRLTGNGILFLVNTAGIYFGPQADVNLGGLIASAQDITNQDFLAGHYQFIGDDVSGMILNEGSIQAADGSYVALIGDAVENRGFIEVPLGSVVLAGAKTVTVGISGNGLISVGLDEAAASEVLDKDGNAIPDLVRNSGDLSGARVALSAKGVNSVFERMINLEGIVRADQVNVGEDGVVEISAEGGSVKASAEVYGAAIEISSDYSLDVEGVYHGDLHLSGGEENTLGHLEVDGSLILDRSGDSAEYSQTDGSLVDVKDSLEIKESVALDAGQASRYVIGRDWINRGNFDAGTSKMLFENPDKISHIYGDNTFYDFWAVDPDKEIEFEAGSLTTVLHEMRVLGAPDQGREEFYIKFRSTEDGEAWFLDSRGDTQINRAKIRDLHSVNYHFIPLGVDKGNNVNLLIDPMWDGGGTNEIWSNAENWDGNEVPIDAELVTFSGMLSSKSVIIDNLGSWSGGDLIVYSDYGGTITQLVPIVIGDFELHGGTWNSQEAFTAVSFTQSGGIFNASVNAGTHHITIDSNMTIEAGVGMAGFTAADGGGTGAGGSSAIFNMGWGNVSIANDFLLAGGAAGLGQPGQTGNGNGGSGGDGGSAIFRVTPGHSGPVGAFSVGGDMTIQGGSGGSGGDADVDRNGGNGGTGGAASFIAENIFGISANDLIVMGGNAGNGANAAAGGSGVDDYPGDGGSAGAASYAGGSGSLTLSGNLTVQAGNAGDGGNGGGDDEDDRAPGGGDGGSTEASFSAGGGNISIGGNFSLNGGTSGAGGRGGNNDFGVSSENINVGGSGGSSSATVTLNGSAVTIGGNLSISGLSGGSGGTGGDDTNGVTGQAGNGGVGGSSNVTFNAGTNLLRVLGNLSMSAGSNGAAGSGGTGLMAGVGGSGGLATASFFGSSGVIDIDTNLSLNASTVGIFRASSTSTRIGGIISSSGIQTFNPNNGTFIFDASTGTKIISTSLTFRHLTFNDGGGNAVFQLGSNLSLSGLLTIQGGTLDVTTNNYSITVGGGWNNQDTFTSWTGTVYFSGAGNLTSGSSSFYNISMTNGTVVMQDDLNVHNLNVGAGRLTMGIHDLTIGNDLSIIGTAGTPGADGGTGSSGVEGNNGVGASFTAGSGRLWIKNDLNIFGGNGGGGGVGGAGSDDGNINGGNGGPGGSGGGAAFTGGSGAILIGDDINMVAGVGGNGGTGGAGGNQGMFIGGSGNGGNGGGGGVGGSASFSGSSGRVTVKGEVLLSATAGHGGAAGADGSGNPAGTGNSGAAGGATEVSFSTGTGGVTILGGLSAEAIAGSGGGHSGSGSMGAIPGNGGNATININTSNGVLVTSGYSPSETDGGFGNGGHDGSGGMDSSGGDGAINITGDGPQVYTNTFSGTVYSDEGATTLGAGRTVGLSMNGSSNVTTGYVNTNGTYTVPILGNAGVGDVMTLFLDGYDEKAVTVSKSDAVTFSGYDLYQDRLVLRSEDGDLSNTNLDTANNSADADITALYSISGGDLTVASGKELFINSGSTYTPGGNVTVTDVDIRGTWTPENYVYYVSGNWSAASGTFVTENTSEVHFVAGSGTKSIAPGGSYFSKVYFEDGDGGLTHPTYELQTDMVAGWELFIGSGATLDTNAAQNYNITIGLNWTNAGTFTANQSTVSFTPDSMREGTITSGGSSFYNLHLTDIDDTSTWTLQDALDVNNDLTVANGTLIVASNEQINVGGNWDVSGFSPGSGAVVFDAGSGTKTIRSYGNSFHHISLTDGNGGLTYPTYQLQDALDANGNFTIGSGAAFDVKSGSDYQVNVGGNWTNSGIFTARNGTVVLNGSGNLTSGSSSFYNLTVNGTVIQQDALAITNNFSLAGTDGVQGEDGSNGGAGGADGQYALFEAGGGAITVGGSMSITSGVGGNGGDGDHGDNGGTGGGSGGTAGGARFTGGASSLSVTGALTMSSQSGSGGNGGEGGNSDGGVGGNGGSSVVYFTGGSGNISFGSISLSRTLGSEGASSGGAGGAAGASEVSFTGGSGTVTSSGNITIGEGVSFTAPSTTLTVGGNFTIQGSFSNNNGTVVLNKAAGNQELNLNAPSITFRNLTHSGAGTVLLNNSGSTLYSLSISDDFTNSAGIFNARGQGITVGDDWINSATFTHGNGTVTFTGASSSITSGGSSFYNLTIRGAATQIDTLAVANNFSITGINGSNGEGGVAGQPFNEYQAPGANGANGSNASFAAGGGNITVGGNMILTGGSGGIGGGGHHGIDGGESGGDGGAGGDATFTGSSYDLTITGALQLNAGAAGTGGFGGDGSGDGGNYAGERVTGGTGGAGGNGGGVTFNAGSGEVSMNTLTLSGGAGGNASAGAVAGGSGGSGGDDYAGSSGDGGMGGDGGAGGAAVLNGQTADISITGAINVNGGAGGIGGRGGDNCCGESLGGAPGSGGAGGAATFNVNTASITGGSTMGITGGTGGRGGDGFTDEEGREGKDGGAGGDGGTATLNGGAGTLEVTSSLTISAQSGNGGAGANSELGARAGDGGQGGSSTGQVLAGAGPLSFGSIILSRILGSAGSDGSGSEGLLGIGGNAGSTNTSLTGSSGTIAAQGNFTMGAGTSLTSSSSDITVNGNFYMNGGSVDLDGGRLEVGGDLDPAAGTFNQGSGDVVVSGVYYQTGGTYNQNSGDLSTGNFFVKETGTFVGGSGTLDINGNFTQEDAGSSFTAPLTMKISNAFNYQSGTFDANSGTIMFNAGSGTKMVTPNGVIFYNLSFADSDGGLTHPIYELQDSIRVQNHLTIGSGTTLDVSENDYQITVQGGWFNSGTFEARGGTVVFDQLTRSDIQSGSSSFNDVQFTESVGGALWTLQDNMDINGDVEWPLGTLDLNGKNLYVGGNWNLGQGDMWDTPGGGSVTFDASSGTKTITSGGLGNFVSHVFFTDGDGGENGPTYSLGDALDVDGDLTINAGATLLGNAQINVSGDWENSGMFNAGSGSVILDGSGDLASGGSSFYDLVISGNRTQQDALSVTSDFTITSGEFDAVGFDMDVDGTFNLSGGTITLNGGNLDVGGDLTPAGGTFNQGSGTVTVAGVYYQTDGIYNQNSGDLTTGNFFVKETGAFVGGSGTLDINGNFTQEDAGSSFTAPSQVRISGNFNRQAGEFDANNGTIIFDADSGTKTITNNGISFYNLSFTDGGGEMAGPVYELQQDPITVTHNLSVYEGTTLDLKGVGITATGAVFSNEGTIQLGGDQSFTDLVQDTDSGTWIFYGDPGGGNSAFTIYDFGDEDYFNLVISEISDADDAYTSLGAITVKNNLSIHSGTMVLSDTLDVDGDLSIGGTGKLDVSEDNHQISISGNWTSSGTFLSREGTVLFNGNSDLTSGGSSFYDFTVRGNVTQQDELTILNDFKILGANGNAGGASAEFIAGGGAIHVSGDFIMTSGNGAAGSAGQNGNLGSSAGTNGASGGNAVFTANASEYDLTVEGDVILTGGSGANAGNGGAGGASIGGSGGWGGHGGDVTVYLGSGENSAAGNFSMIGGNAGTGGAGGASSVSAAGGGGGMGGSGGAIRLYASSSELAVGGNLALSGGAGGTGGVGAGNGYGAGGSGGLVLLSISANDTVSVDGNMSMTAGTGGDGGAGSLPSLSVLSGVRGGDGGSGGTATVKLGGDLIIDGAFTMTSQSGNGGDGADNAAGNSGSGGYGGTGGASVAEIDDWFSFVGNLSAGSVSLSRSAGSTGENGTDQGGEGGIGGGGQAGSADVTAIGVSSSGDVTIGAGTTFYASSNPWTVSGDFLNNGLFYHSGEVVFNKASGMQTADFGGDDTGSISHTGAGTLRFVNHDINAIALSNSNGTLDTNGRNITAASLTVSGGTFEGSSGVLDINGNVSLTGGILNATSGNFAVAGNWSKTGGTFNPGTGTVIFNKGYETQTLNTGGASFYHLSNTLGGILQLSANALDISGNLSNSGTLDLNGLDLSVDGTVSNESGATIKLQGLESVSFALGNDIDSGTWEYIGNGTNTYAPADFSNTSAGGLDYYNLLINPSNAGGVLQLNAAKNIAGTLTVSNGTFDANGYAVTVTGTAAVNNTGTYLAGTALQIFGGLTLSGSGVFTGSSGTVDVNGNVSIANTSALTAPSLMTVSGNWSKTGGTFNPGSGTVEFDKVSGTQTFNSGGSNFRNVKHSGSGTLQLSGALTATGTMDNSAGIFDLSTANFSLAGTLTNDATIRLAGISSQTVTLSSGNDIDSGLWEYVGNNTSTAASIRDFSSLGTDYYNLRISSTSSSQVYSSSAAKNIAGTFTVTNGTYNANGNTTSVTGLTTVSGGTYSASTAQQTLDGGFSLSGGAFTGSTGLIDVNGNVTQTGGTLTAPSLMKVSGNWSRTSGTFTSGSGTVEFDKASGTQTLNSGANFRNIVHSGAGTLQLSGALSALGTLTNSSGVLDLSTHALSLTGALSNDATIRLAGTQSVTLTSGNDINSGLWEYQGDNTSSTITLKDFSLGGADYYDLRISSLNGTQTYSSGGLKSVAGSLTVTNGIYDANGHDTEVSGMAAVSGGEYRAGSGEQTLGGLTVSGSGIFSGASGEVNALGDLSISGSGILTAPSSNFYVSGDWNNAGTFDANAGTVIFNGTNQTLSGDSTFHHFNKTVNTADTLTFEAESTQTIAGVLTLQGASNQLLRIRSSVPGMLWSVNPQSETSINFVDLRDTANLGLQINLLSSTFLDSGNNTGFLFRLPPPASGLTEAALKAQDEGTRIIETPNTPEIFQNLGELLFSDNGGMLTLGSPLIAMPDGAEANLEDLLEENAE